MKRATCPLGWTKAPPTLVRGLEVSAFSRNLVRITPERCPLCAGTGVRFPPDYALNRTWVFKGGTCLRKCYYETYRFSEDLDFTVVGGGPEQPEDLMAIFGEVAEWTREESGIQLVLDEKSFQRRKNKRGNPTTQGRLAYRGPNDDHSMPKVKLDLTSDELLVDQPVPRPIGHPYSDRLPVA
ncbi:MAG TPA: nucleotidyl transferase AbiEii/AbiGii toxin family protein, partial [Acidimicrobiales bacterium]|nr:nucleotidyl transferase AbiEii/AbiGii toxin family protein [Acidimicrobiales bacterium]